MLVICKFSLGGVSTSIAHLHILISTQPLYSLDNFIITAFSTLGSCKSYFYGFDRPAMLLQPLAVGLAFTLASTHALPHHWAANTCKPIPGDTAWPAESKWIALNKTVSGRLIRTVPLPSVCHNAPFNNFNEAACTKIKTAWTDDQTLCVSNFP